MGCFLPPFQQSLLRPLCSPPPGNAVNCYSSPPSLHTHPDPAVGNTSSESSTAGSPNGDVRHDVTQLLGPSTSELSSSWKPLLPTSSWIHPTRHGFRPWSSSTTIAPSFWPMVGFKCLPLNSWRVLLKKCPHILKAHVPSHSCNTLS